jgi:hypothetical protein
MPSNTRGSSADQVTVVCTANAAGNCTLTPIDTDLYIGTTIVFNGNAGFVVGQTYALTIERRS